jgi:hypothetical protein
MSWSPLENFRLAGGTALSLQLGHRKSIDIDLFSEHEFNKLTLSKLLRKKFPNADIQIAVFGITVYLKQNNTNILKIDIVETEPFIRDINIIENIRLANVEDIAAMKLNAITSRT